MGKYLANVSQLICGKVLGSPKSSSVLSLSSFHSGPPGALGRSGQCYMVVKEQVPYLRHIPGLSLPSAVTTRCDMEENQPYCLCSGHSREH